MSENQPESWLLENLEFFLPEGWERHLPPRPFPYAPLLELMIVCHHGAASDRLVAAAAALARRAIAEPRFRQIVAAPGRNLPFLIWFLGLAAAAGIDCEQDLLACQHYLHAGLRPSLDGVGALELAYAAKLAGLDPRLPSAAALYERWRAGQLLNPLHMSNADCYAVTHAIFYRTRFGQESMPGDDELQWVMRLLVHERMHCGDHDLGSELIHAMNLLPAPPGSTPPRDEGRGWVEQLQLAQREDGYVAGPTRDEAFTQTLTGLRARAYTFGTGYHTTLVTRHALWRTSRAYLATGDDDVCISSDWDRLAVRAARRNDLDALAGLVDAGSTPDSKLWHAAHHLVTASRTAQHASPDAVP